MIVFAGKCVTLANTIYAINQKTTASRCLFFYHQANSKIAAFVHSENKLLIFLRNKSSIKIQTMCSLVGVG